MIDFLSDNKILTEGILIGNRIPKDFFITSGKGESDICIHAGSYHLALKNAGIEQANIISYSSVLPSIAKEIKKREIRHFGSVVETIMATANGSKGVVLSAGVKIGWLYHKVSGERYGGLVCEHGAQCSKKELESILFLSLEELYTNGFDEEYELREEKIITKTFTPKKEYGTVLVSLCFTNYLYPILE